MKIKKAMVLVMSIFVIVCLVGCGTPKDAKAVANVLAKQTSKLNEVVEKLEDVNYDDIVVSEISPLSDSTFNTVSKSTALSKAKWYSVGNGKTGTYNTQTTGTSHNNNGAKFVNGNQYDGEKIGLVRSNKPYSTSTSTKNTVKRINSNQYCENGDCSYNYVASNQSEYKPKYVNEVSDNFSRTTLDEYIANIEVIYNNSADCVSCNAEYKNEKSILLQNISDCKTLVQKLRDGTIKLTTDEVGNCNDCLTELNKCTTRLNSTKGNISSKQQTLSKLKNNFSSNISGLKSAYKNLYEALDNRLDCLKDCNDKLCCASDIINKTNVDKEQAETNKSDQQDIVDYNKEDENQQIIDDNNEENLNSTNNDSQTNSSTDTSISNTEKNINNNTLEKQNSTISSQQPAHYIEQLDDQNKIINNNQNYSNTLNNNSKNHNLNNVNNQKEKAENNANAGPINNQNSNKNVAHSNSQTQTSNQNGYKNNVNNNQSKNTGVNNNIGNYANRNIANGNYNNGINNGYANGNGLNGGYNYNNGVNGGFNNGINNGYGYNNNLPYPPRNIDTYQNINKNTDTYSPNYLPGNQYNNGALSTQSTANTNQFIKAGNDNASFNESKDELNNKKIDSQNVKNDAENSNFVKRPYINQPKTTKNLTTHKFIKNVNDNIPVNPDSNVSPLPNPFDEKKLEKKDNLDKESGKEQDDETLHSTDNNKENQEKLDTMQKEKDIDNITMPKKDIDKKIGSLGSKTMEKY